MMVVVVYVYLQCKERSGDGKVRGRGGLSPLCLLCEDDDE